MEMQSQNWRRAVRERKTTNRIISMGFLVFEAFHARFKLEQNNYFTRLSRERNHHAARYLINVYRHYEGVGSAGRPTRETETSGGHRSGQGHGTATGTQNKNRQCPCFVSWQLVPSRAVAVLHPPQPPVHNNANDLLHRLQYVKYAAFGCGHYRD